VGHVENPVLKRTMRKQVAQLNTLIHEHVLAERKAAVVKAIQDAGVAEAK